MHFLVREQGYARLEGQPQIYPSFVRQLLQAAMKNGKISLADVRKTTTDSEARRQLGYLKDHGFVRKKVSRAKRERVYEPTEKAEAVK